MCVTFANFLLLAEWPLTKENCRKRSLIEWRSQGAPNLKSRTSSYPMIILLYHSLPPESQCRQKFRCSTNTVRGISKPDDREWWGEYFDLLPPFESWAARSNMKPNIFSNRTNGKQEKIRIPSLSQNSELINFSRLVSMDALGVPWMPGTHGISENHVWHLQILRF